MDVDFIGELAGHDFKKAKRKPKKYEGAAIGTVIANCDLVMRGRVQVKLDSAPDLKPWASVVSPMAGSGYGFFIMPQVGDLVALMFNKGDINEPIVFGVLRKAIDLPQTKIPTEAITKRKIRTPVGHEIDFDDATQALTITSSSLQKVSMDLDAVELTAGLGAASIKLSTDGVVTITAATKIEFNAITIALNSTNVEINAAESATLNGGASCTIRGGMVNIN